MTPPSFWLRLINSANQYSDQEDQRIAHLMALIFIFITPIGMLAAIIPPIMRNENVFLDPEFQLMIIIILIVIPLYFMSRSKYYKKCGIILISLSSIAVFWAASQNNPPQEISALYYLIIPVILSAVFFSKQAFAFTSIINGIALALIPFFVFNLPQESIVNGPLIFFIIISVFIWLIDHYQRVLGQSKHHAIQSQFKKLQILYQLSNQVAQAKSLDEIYEAAINALCQALPVDRAAIMLFDTDGIIRFKKSTGLSEWYQQQVTGHSPWDSNENDPQPILISNIQEDDRFPELHDTILQEGIHSLAFIPLVYRALFLGKFMLYYNTPHLFTDIEIQLAQTISSQISLGLVRKMAEQAVVEKSNALTRSNTFIAVLSQVATRIESTPKLDEVLFTLGSELNQLEMSCMLALLDKNTKDLIVQQYNSIPDAHFKQLNVLLNKHDNGIRIKHSQWKKNRSFLSGNSVYYSNPIQMMTTFVDQPHDEFYEIIKIVGMTDQSGIILLPLMVENAINGLLVVWGDDIVEADLPAFSVFAGQVAIVIERTRLFEELRASEERYRAVSELVSDWAYAYQINQEGQLVRDWTTDAFERATGYQPQELMSEASWLQIVHPNDQALFQSRKKMLLSGKAITNEYRIITKAGEVRWIRDYSLPIIQPSSAMVTRIYGAAQDITTLKLTQDRTYQQQKFESLGLMAGGVAHDFNNLLVAMLGQTSLALAKMSHESQGRTHIEKAVKAAEQAAELTQQMLAYSGNTYFEKVLIDLRKVIKDNLSFLQATISKRIEVTTDFSNKSALIEADAGQIQQVVMNLIINAAEAIGDAEGSIRIKVDTLLMSERFLQDKHLAGALLKPGNYVHLTVEDNGTGMDAITKERIFDPFYTTKFTGRGLGLAAVLGIMQGHDGGILVESEIGRGSIFHLFFPISTNGDVQRNETAVSPPPANRSAQILLIDDETAVCDAVSDILKLAGITVLIAPNGKEGIELYANQHADIDLVMLDLSMPGLSGEETFQALQQLNPDVKVILSSGYNESEITNRFKDQGLAGFIQKPYRANTLVQEIQHFLNKFQDDSSEMPNGSQY